MAGICFLWQRYGALRVNIRLEQRGVSAKTVKNDKKRLESECKKEERCQKKEGCFGFSNAGKPIEEKILKSVSQNA